MSKFKVGAFLLALVIIGIILICIVLEWSNKYARYILIIIGILVLCAFIFIISYQNSITAEYDFLNYERNIETQIDENYPVESSNELFTAEYDFSNYEGSNIQMDDDDDDNNESNESVDNNYDKDKREVFVAKPLKEFSKSYNDVTFIFKQLDDSNISFWFNICKKGQYVASSTIEQPNVLNELLEKFGPNVVVEDTNIWIGYITKESNTHKNERDDINNNLGDFKEDENAILVVKFFCFNNKEWHEYKQIDIYGSVHFSVYLDEFEKFISSSQSKIDH
jgi:hypothetical protein